MPLAHCREEIKRGHKKISANGVPFLPATNFFLLGMSTRAQRIRSTSPEVRLHRPPTWPSPIADNWKHISPR
jgi:hypothetical protein